MIMNQTEQIFNERKDINIKKDKKRTKANIKLSENLHKKRQYNLNYKPKLQNRIH